MLGMRVVAAVAAVIVAAAFALADAAGAGACAGRSYAYAGFGSTKAAAGIGASVATVALPRVAEGHVAAFVGVGGPGLGPNGTDEWIQIGVSGFVGGSSSVYSEIARPGRPPVYTELKADVRPGETHRIAVREEGAQPNWWRVWLDGRPASAATYLPGSDRRWAPVATAESWTPGGAACNAYTYRFDGVSVTERPGGAWGLLGDHYSFSDAGYRVVRRSGAAFVATTSPGTEPRRELVSVRR